MPSDCTSMFFFSAIVLTHYKLKAEGVAQCLISGASHLTSDVLRQLLAFAPDDQEVAERNALDSHETTY